MNPLPVIDAVILAAGNGSRLVGAGTLPKPLVPVAGRPLLDRIVDALEQTPIQFVHVIVGFRADAVEQHMSRRGGRIGVGCIRNPEFDRPNGVSLLCAEGHLGDRPFLLLMADHLFEVETVTAFLARPCPTDGVLLAVDRNRRGAFDVDDATKVTCQDTTISAIGKDLGDYDAIDTGMFLCSARVFDAMRESANAGEAALSGGMAALARAGRAHAWDIGARHWIDVDTPEALDEAVRLIGGGCFRLPAF
jgi:1L-myo-inositol 1-phosphate cytidylyltransferase